MTPLPTPRVDADRSGGLPEPFGFDAPGDRWIDALRDAEAPLPCGRIGPYELIEEIGRGGQGLVFRAIQTVTHRPIALKRLLGGSFASAAMRRRFEREIEALSALNHPHIVSVFGTELIDGIPILAMEWVDGTPINRFVAGRGERMPVDDTVRLFQKVCDAVHHAHQRGVIHRDLKPSNVLIDTSGEPRVLDFGLAKLRPAAGETAVSVTEHFAGTLRYASPEQLDGRPEGVDVRSDVYSLGVLLYELLTGRLPLDLGDDAAGAARAIVRQAPPPPSSVRGGIDAALNAVALKALAASPADRYQSAESFSADLGHWLTGEPVAAAQASVWASLNRFVRRHRAAAALMLAGLAVVVGGGAAAGVLAAWLAQQRNLALVAQDHLAEARDRAENEAVKAEAVARFLQDMLVQADPMSGRPRDITVLEMLDAAAQKMERSADMPPAVEAATQKALGVIFHSLGRHDYAERHLRRTLKLQEELHPEDHPDKAAALHELGHLMTSIGRYEEAERLLRAGLRMRRATLGDDHVDTAESQSNLGKLLYLRGDYGACETMMNDTLAIRRRRLGEGHPLVGSALSTLAAVRKAQGRMIEAESLMREALEISRAAQGPEHPDVSYTLHSLAAIRRDQGDVAGAEALFEESLALKRKALGDDHPAVGFTLQSLGDLHVHLGDDSKAETYYLQVLPIYQRAMDADHPRTRQLLTSLIELYGRTQRPDEAARYRSLLNAEKPQAAPPQAP